MNRNFCRCSPKIRTKMLQFNKKTHAHTHKMKIAKISCKKHQQSARLLRKIQMSVIFLRITEDKNTQYLSRHLPKQQTIREAEENPQRMVMFSSFRFETGRINVVLIFCDTHINEYIYNHIGIFIQTCIHKHIPVYKYTHLYSITYTHIFKHLYIMYCLFNCNFTIS